MARGDNDFISYYVKRNAVWISLGPLLFLSLSLSLSFSLFFPSFVGPLAEQDFCFFFSFFFCRKLARVVSRPFHFPTMKLRLEWRWGDQDLKDLATLLGSASHPAAKTVRQEYGWRAWKMNLFMGNVLPNQARDWVVGELSALEWLCAIYASGPILSVFHVRSVLSFINIRSEARPPQSGKDLWKDCSSTCRRVLDLLDQSALRGTEVQIEQLTSFESRMYQLLLQHKQTRAILCDYQRRYLEAATRLVLKYPKLEIAPFSVCENGYGQLFSLSTWSQHSYLLARTDVVEFSRFCENSKRDDDQRNSKDLKAWNLKRDHDERNSKDLKAWNSKVWIMFDVLVQNNWIQKSDIVVLIPDSTKFEFWKPVSRDFPLHRVQTFPCDPRVERLRCKHF